MKRRRWNDLNAATDALVLSKRAVLEARRDEIHELFRREYRGEGRVAKARVLLEKLGLMHPLAFTSRSREAWLIAFSEVIRRWRRKGVPIGSKGGNLGGFWWLATEEERARVIGSLESARNQIDQTIEALRKATL